MRAFRELADMTQMDGVERSMQGLSLDYTLQNVMGSPGQDFLHAKESVIRELIEMLWLADVEAVHYFQPLVALGKKEKFTIATLNYDNTIELACEVSGIPCSTGLEAWNNLEGFPEPEQGIDLLKLHGSVTWRKIGSGYNRSEEVPLPRVQIEKQEREAIRRGYNPAIIFGAGNKLTAEGPFLELLLAFRERLDQCTELIIIGYSFGDDHINDALWRWLNRSKSHKVTVVDYSEDKTVTPFANIFHYMMDRYTFHLDGAGMGIKKLFGS